MIYVAMLLVLLVRNWAPRVTNQKTQGSGMPRSIKSREVSKMGGGDVCIIPDNIFDTEIGGDTGEWDPDPHDMHEAIDVQVPPPVLHPSRDSDSDGGNTEPVGGLAGARAARAFRCEIDKRKCIARFAGIKVFRYIALGTNKRFEGDSKLAQAFFSLSSTSPSLVVEKFTEVLGTLDRSEKAGARAYAITMNANQVLDPQYPGVEGWRESVGKEVASLFDQGVLRAIPIEQMNRDFPVRDLLPALLVCVTKSTGRKKSRIVACGNFQSTSKQDCYSWVCSQESWLGSMLLTLALHRPGREMSIKQVDIEIAFLQTRKENSSRVEVPTFLRIPKQVHGATGDPTHDSKGYVWQVIKFIYGLRTAPKDWWDTLVGALERFGYACSALDDCVLIKSGDGCVIAVYVDDLLVMGGSRVVDETLKYVADEFLTTPPKCLLTATEADPLEFLGKDLWVEGENENRKLIVSTTKHVDAMFTKLNMSDCNPLTVLNPNDFDFSKALDGTEVLNSADQTLLRSYVGATNYTSLSGRPDLVVASAKTSEGQAQGTLNHLSAAKRLVRCCKGTRGRRMEINIINVDYGDELEVRVYFDADFCSGYARTGLVYTLATPGSEKEMIFGWRSSKQKAITLSTTEAELVACSSGAREAIGLVNYFDCIFNSECRDSNKRVNFVSKIFGDNRACNFIAARQSGVRRVRHLDLSHLFVRDAVRDKKLTIHRVETSRNPSNMLTKVLGGSAMRRELILLSLYDHHIADDEHVPKIEVYSEGTTPGDTSTNPIVVDDNDDDTQLPQYAAANTAQTSVYPELLNRETKTVVKASYARYHLCEPPSQARMRGIIRPPLMPDTIRLENDVRRQYKKYCDGSPWEHLKGGKFYRENQ